MERCYDKASKVLDVINAWRHVGTGECHYLFRQRKSSRITTVIAKFSPGLDKRINKLAAFWYNFPLYWIDNRDATKPGWVLLLLLHHRIVPVAATVTTVMRRDQDTLTGKLRACVGQRPKRCRVVTQRGGAKMLLVTLSASASATATVASALSTITLFPSPKVLS